MEVKTREYVEAARAIGAGAPEVSCAISCQTFGAAHRPGDARDRHCRIRSGRLSYLGLGARPPAPEWGAMLNDARDYWTSAPWALIFPGLAITTLVFGFNLLGDGLRDAMDPTLSR